MKPKTLLVFTNIGIALPGSFPTDLGALSAYLKRAGFPVVLHSIERPRELAAFRQILEEVQPDVVGFTAIYSQFQFASELAAVAKAWRPELRVLLGGKHATLEPERCIEDPNLDGICVGEGEQALLEYLQALEAGREPHDIPNLWLRRGEEIERGPVRPFIEDLDTLPFWDYGALDYQRSIRLHFNSLTMLVGRGLCHAACTFCGVPNQRHRGAGHFSRYRSVGHVLDEIAMLEQRYRFRYIYFRDDTFTLDRDWALAFAKAYRQRFSYPYEFLTRADRLDPELMEALAASGCECIWLGADAGNDRIRNEVLRKSVGKQQLLDTCEVLWDVGIRPLLTNMIGLPHETPEMAMETVELNRRVYAGRPMVSRFWGAGPAVFAFGPFPGSPLHRLCQEQGWIKELGRDYRTYSETYIEMPGFPLSELYDLLRRFRYLVYRDSNPAWARWCLLKDTWNQRTRGRANPEGLLRRLEYRAIHGGPWI